MTDIVEFLTARLDEDEEAAILAARGAAYQTGDEAPEWSVRAPLALWSAPRGGAFGEVRPMAIRAAAHIARHDPARVLREVAAKRKLLALSAGMRELAVVDGAWHLNALADSIERDMVSVYDDHPDYEQAWRME
jgi:hypothetical protein